MKFWCQHFLKVCTLIMVTFSPSLFTTESIAIGYRTCFAGRPGLGTNSQNRNNSVFSSQVSCSVSDLKVSQINPTEATFSYIAYGSQVAEHGVCYATEPNPMRISSKKARAYKDVPIDLPESNTLITVTAEQLKPATKYYARAYVKNSSEETFYSNEISFSTASATAVGMRNNKDSLSGITQDTATLREFRRFNGVQTEKYENGNLMRVYNLQDGKLNGSFKFFNEKGQLVSDQNFSNGEPNGYYRTYYVSGQLRSEMNLKDGVQDGPTKEYFENGNLKMESNCSGPPFKASGQVKVYYENGQLRTETMLSNGVPTQSVGYDQDGRLVSEETPGNSIMYWYDRNGERHTTINGVEQK